MVQELAFKDIPYMQFLQPFCTAPFVQDLRNNEDLFNQCNFLNMDKWFRRCCLKVFLIYSTDINLVWRSRIICAIWVQGIINFDCKINLNSD